MSGAKAAIRVPTTTRASPRRMRHQVSCRSPADSPECSTASSSPTTDATRSASWVTSETSGTSTMAAPPASRVDASAAR